MQDSLALGVIFAATDSVAVLQVTPSRQCHPAGRGPSSDMPVAHHTRLSLFDNSNNK